MSELEPATRSVQIDLSHELIPDLLNVLGPFVAKHNLRIDFSDPASKQRDRDLSAQTAPNLNPELVTLVESLGEDDLIPCITSDSLIAYEKKHGLQRGLAQRFTHVISENKLNRGFRSYLATLPNNSRRRETDPELLVVGIKANTAHELLSKLEDGSLTCINVGPTAVGFFRKYCEDLFVDGIPPQSKPSSV